MNERGLSGVLMLGAAAALAWAWLTGRLDGQIAQVVAQAKKVGTQTSAQYQASVAAHRGGSLGTGGVDEAQL